jgi:hypothetical protein
VSRRVGRSFGPGRPIQPQGPERCQHLSQVELDRCTAIGHKSDDAATPGRQKENDPADEASDQYASAQQEGYEHPDTHGWHGHMDVSALDDSA